MPRTNNFQGLPDPFFLADAYYFAGNTNPAPKRPARSKTRSSLSSDSAPSQTSKATSLAGSKDDNTSQTGTSPSHARAHSASSSRRPGPGTSSRRRPSTATSSTTSPQSRDPPSLFHLAASTVLQSPAITADDINKMDSINSPPLLADSTTSISATIPKFVMKNGKRHHPYSSKIAPYPRSYDSTAIDQ